MLHLHPEARLKTGTPAATAVLIAVLLTLHIVLSLCTGYGLLSDDHLSTHYSFRFGVDWSRFFFFPFVEKNSGVLLGEILGFFLFGAVVEDRLGSGPFLGLFLFLGAVFAGILWTCALALGKAVPYALGPAGIVTGLMGLVLKRFGRSWVEVTFRFPGLVFAEKIHFPLALMVLLWIPVTLLPLLKDDPATPLGHGVMLVLGLLLGRWVILRTPYEDLMDKGRDYLSSKMYHEAAVEFEKALLLEPGDPILHEKLGVCYFGLQDPEDPLAKMRKKAQGHFVRALELYSDQESMMAGLHLYQRLLRFLPKHAVPEDVARPLREFNEKEGPLGVSLSHDPLERRAQLQDHFLRLVNEGSGVSALGVLEDILKEPGPENLPPNVLEAGASLCKRSGKPQLAEDLFLWLLGEGNRRQVFMGMLFLNTQWRGTPKQTRLPELVRKAEDRLTGLAGDPDWEELKSMMV